MSGINQPHRRLPRGYRERKLLEPPVCARAGCALPPADDSDLCTPHREDARARSRRAHRRRRAARRAVSACASCGGPSERYLCPTCTVRLGRTRQPGVNNSVNNTRDRFSADRDGRVRFRGKGRRGRQSNASLDAQDGADAARELRRMLDGLAYAETLPSDERAGVIRAALDHGGLVQRFVEVIFERHRYRTGGLPPRRERKR